MRQSRRLCACLNQEERHFQKEVEKLRFAPDCGRSISRTFGLILSVGYVLRGSEQRIAGSFFSQDEILFGTISVAFLVGRSKPHALPQQVEAESTHSSMEQLERVHQLQDQRAITKDRLHVLACKALILIVTENHSRATRSNPNQMLLAPAPAP